MDLLVLDPVAPLPLSVHHRYRPVFLGGSLLEFFSFPFCDFFGAGVPPGGVKMDVTALRDRIQCTLDANTSIRQQAELDLKYVRRDIE